jgi:hypothetical protein
MTKTPHDDRLTKMREIAHPLRNNPRLWWLAMGVLIASVDYPADWPGWIGAAAGGLFLGIAVNRDRRYRSALEGARLAEQFLTDHPDAVRRHDA